MAITFDNHDTDSRVLADIRELLYLLALNMADNKPGTLVDKKLRDFQERRMVKF